MNKKTVYTDAPAEIEEELNYSVKVEDFLPSPANLRAMEKEYETNSMSKTKFAKQLNKIK